MTYPAPLQPQTIARRIEKAGFSETEKQFFPAFLAAAANTYGMIDMDELWEVYKVLRNHNEPGFPVISKAKLCAYAGLARRMADMPYRIYQASELYREAPTGPEAQIIVHHELIGINGYSLDISALPDQRRPYSIYVPTEFLQCSVLHRIPAELEFHTFLDRLRTNSEILQANGIDPEQIKQIGGRRLNNFLYLNADEQKELQLYTDFYSPQEADAYQQSIGRSESEKLTRRTVHMLRTGLETREEIADHILNELDEIGAHLSDYRFMIFGDLFEDLADKLPSWAYWGWPPKDAQ